MAAKATATKATAKAPAPTPVKHDTTYDAIRAIRWEMNAIKKEKMVKGGGDWMYRGIDDVYNELHGLFATHGIFMTSKIIDRANEMITLSGRNGDTTYLLLLATIEYSFHGPDETVFKTEIVTTGMDNSDKGAGKLMSYGQKYAILQFFLIPTQDMQDTDQFAAEGKLNPPPPARPVAPPAPAKPRAPVAPLKPTAPVAPVAPVKPTAPPVAPVAPTAPPAPPASPPCACAAPVASATAPAPATAPAGRPKVVKAIGENAKKVMVDTLGKLGIHPNWLPAITGLPLEHWTTPVKDTLIQLHQALDGGEKPDQTAADMMLATFEQMGVSQIMLETYIQVLMPSWTEVQIDQATELFEALLNGTVSVESLK